MVSTAWDYITHKVMNLKVSLQENKNDFWIYFKVVVNVKTGVVNINT